MLVDEGAGTLITIAKDVKVQVEFNPGRVARWRLIGYENRALAARDFNDDTKDAGELGAGHTVTVLYELEATGKTTGDLLKVNVRYQKPQGSPTKLLSFPVTDAGQTFERSSAELRWAWSRAPAASLGRIGRPLEPLRDTKRMY